MANFHNLADDVLILILTRLPLKTLTKFLTVSESWYSLITSADFVSAHLLFLHRRPKPTFLNLDSKFIHSIFSNRSTRLASLFACATFAGSSYGVLCFLRPDRTVCLWNPTIGKHLNLNLHAIPKQHPHLSLGFGFDSSSNDFKVVTISYNSSLTASNSPDFLPRTHVYSLNSGAWRVAEFPPRSRINLITPVSKATFVNGVIHWIASFAKIRELGNENPVKLKRGGSILTFDVQSESFGEVGFPSSLVNAPQEDVYLATVDNSLALVHAATWVYPVWVMKKNGDEASWRFIYRIRMKMPVPYWFMSLQYYSSAKAFITACHGTFLIVLDEKKPSSSLVDGDAVSFNGDVFSYTESLALLDRFSSPWRKNHISGE